MSSYALTSGDNVADYNTGLVWTRRCLFTEPESYRYYVQSIQPKIPEKWRLPTRQELVSLGAASAIKHTLHWPSTSYFFVFATGEELPSDKIRTVVFYRDSLRAIGGGATIDIQTSGLFFRLVKPIEKERPCFFTPELVKIVGRF